MVNGEKTYITNGVRAHFIVTAVKTTQDGGHHGISFLIVDRGEGVSSSKLDKLGWHASDTATISFQDVFVPEHNLLGELNEGFKLIMANFQWERLAMALGAVGAMALAWERTAQFARERQAFGRSLSGHQAIRHKLADLATSVYTCRCTTYDALRRFVAGQDALKEVTMAKLLTQRACFELMDACLQIHGGAGYMREYFDRARRTRRAPGPDRRWQRRDHARDPWAHARRPARLLNRPRPDDPTASDDSTAARPRAQARSWDRKLCPNLYFTSQACALSCRCDPRGCTSIRSARRRARRGPSHLRGLLDRAGRSAVPPPPAPRRPQSWLRKCQAAAHQA